MQENILPPLEANGAFGVFRNANLRRFLATYLIAMMADNIEHVVSYWVLYQKFHSPALAGFAVLAHWLPFLCLSIVVGSMADRFDPRRIIQIGMSIFIFVSLAWGFLLVTGAIQAWHAVVLLLLHGCAGVLWQPTSQLLLHEIVSPPELPSAVRLNSAALYLGLLAGPAVGGLLLVKLGPVVAILLNAGFYIPLFLWMFRAPYIRDKIALARENAVRGFSDIFQIFREMRVKAPVMSMILLAGAASFFVGNSYQAQMPALAHRFLNADSGTAYSALLTADAAGALIAVLVLEALASKVQKPRTAVILAMGWSLSLITFAATQTYMLGLMALFVAGFFELAFSSTAQTIVQLSAPADIRGRVFGVFAMAALGCRAFSGIWVGVVGAVLSVNIALCFAAAGTLAMAAILLFTSTFRVNLAISQQ